MGCIPNLKDLVLRDTTFAQLMNKRIYNVLLVATKYDAFMLEDDGRVDEQIFNEYVALNLRYPPRFTQVTTQLEALEELQNRNFELIICMPNMYDKDAFASAKNLKESYPDIPTVVLTPFSKEVSKRIETEDLGSIDYVFSWLGNAELLIAIIKLIEDEMNIPDDTASVGVQIILVVEDSVRFYSSLLTHVYQFILEQSMIFAQEALNDHLQMLRMRGRPKIKLARTYEEAVAFYDMYKKNILGVITDMSFARNGEKDPRAGYALCDYLQRSGEIIPLIIESSDADNYALAKALHASFINKNSKTYPQDLRRKIQRRFGFGDFIIINPDTGEEIMQIKDLKDLQTKINQIPDASLTFHLRRNHFSRFLYSRAIFPPAEVLKYVDVSDYTNLDEARRFIFNLIVEYRKMRNAGVVAIYRKDRFDEYSNFARIGNGSLGGKGRGLAFMGTMVKRYPKLSSTEFEINIPKTTVICTDLFDSFMRDNNLYPIALSNATDEVILKAFLAAQLPKVLIEDLQSLLMVMTGPLAVRSSSLLEDSHYQPFAGVYSTYMVPPAADTKTTLEQVKLAIKGVYASVFYADSKTYMNVTQNIIDQEKMAVVIQEVVGTTYTDGTFYPTLSGVARSLNFYPINDEQVRDGVANVALGLGKYIVDGGTTLRFSPRHPHSILQMSSLDFALRDTQTKYVALDLKADFGAITIQDGFNLKTLTLKDADAHGILREVASTYDPQNMCIWDGYYPGGRKVISFVHFLQHETFPLAETIHNLLQIGEKEIGKPVEIEFAMNLHPEDKHKAHFFLLQIRPIVHTGEEITENLAQVQKQETIVWANDALGNGITHDAYDVIYVKSDSFERAHNPKIAQEIAQRNALMVEKHTPYVLIGPGRWGSSDHWLGIPVNWPQISQACCIVETASDLYQVEPSQGTHFFQNLTSFGVGYFTIAPFRDKGYLDEDFLNAQPAVYETEHIRHVHFDAPVCIKIDGPKHLGVIMKPGL